MSLPGAEDRESQALGDLHVVCLSAMGPVPFAAMLLSDLGARVTRVDRPGRSERVTGLSLHDDPRTRGHRGVGIDLRSEGGRSVLLRLLGDADVFLEGMRPGATERLGIGPDDLLAVNPRLVYGRATGWGQSGPRAQQAGHDINYAGLAGAVFPLGPADAPPLPPLNMLADFGGGGTYLALGVLAALHQRRRTGRGQVVDAAMVDGVASLTSMMHGMLAAGSWSDERGDNLLDGAAPFYRTYRTSDGGFMAVGSLEPQFYRDLLDALALDPDEWPQHDRSRWPAQAAALGEIFASRTRAAWEEVFAGRDACVTPVLSLAEAGASRELRERGTYVEWDGVSQPAPAPRLSDSPVVRRPRSRWCGDTDGVLATLGYPTDEIAALRADGVVA
ncbi:CaiB/BaiF CoA-transferase family protein [Nocardioides sp. cx-173]|uniref:CaiB/BaiF CoA transferase family protein n=1 Tax=Nocardioides sp. cx-173 TaxID=2898796 RepID=UPI001E65C9F4|nr:CaiB/BaiF CoA-transferase family protein [Nocardioides sp. cx-173]MCD4524287.1 CoA transferase [Nocardioides sp. cx-173]UGB41679.1 CoA transferase [Nocardioides sp. cx-173]